MCMYAHSFGLTRPLWSGSINNIFPTDVLTFANLFLACVKMAQTNSFIYSSVLNQYHFLFNNINQYLSDDVSQCGCQQVSIF